MLLTARCPVCDSPVSPDCASCWSATLPAPEHSAVPAAVAFVGAGRRLVLGLKYRNGRTLARPLARRMSGLVDGEVDLVTWAPTSSVRLRRRGFDQAELIARALAAELGVPCRRMLRRIGGSTPQTGRSRRQRLAATPRFVARRTWGEQVRVVLVDDVVTTGATLSAARAALISAGVTDVVCIAAAATP